MAKERWLMEMERPELASQNTERNPNPGVQKQIQCYLLEVPGKSEAGEFAVAVDDHGDGV